MQGVLLFDGRDRHSRIYDWQSILFNNGLSVGLYSNSFRFLNLLIPAFLVEASPVNKGNAEKNEKNPGYMFHCCNVFTCQ